MSDEWAKLLLKSQIDMQGTQMKVSPGQGVCGWTGAAVGSSLHLLAYAVCSFTQFIATLGMEGMGVEKNQVS